MQSPTEALKLIAENNFQLLVDDATPDDVWIVTPDGKPVQMLAAGGTYRSALRIPKEMFEAFVGAALLDRSGKQSDGRSHYRLTPAGSAKGLTTPTARASRTGR
jgi:hypothetical protein